MEIIRKERQQGTGRSITLAERLHELEEKVDISEKKEVTKEKTRLFKWPVRWRFKFNRSTKRRNEEMMLVFFLNKKNEIEPPRFMPIFDGNMIIWKNKPYEFDPRAVWTIKGVRRNPRAYIIKEIDRRPIRNKEGKLVRTISGKVFWKDAAVSNLDLDKIRNRGDSTESDEFLIKAALKAQTSQMKKGMNVAILIIIIIAIVGGLIWFLSSK